MSFFVDTGPFIVATVTAAVLRNFPSLLQFFLIFFFKLCCHGDAYLALELVLYSADSIGLASSFNV